MDDCLCVFSVVELVEECWLWVRVFEDGRVGDGRVGGCESGWMGDWINRWKDD